MHPDSAHDSVSDATALIIIVSSSYIQHHPSRSSVQNLFIAKEKQEIS